MLFSELVKKLASGQPLNPAEQQQIYFEARKLEQAEALLNSIVQTGTQRLHLQSVTIANGDVLLYDAGIVIKNNAEAALVFEDADGDRDKIYIVSGLSNQLSILNKNADGTILLKQAVTGDAASSAFLSLKEDPAQSGRLLVTIGEGNADNEGLRFQIGNGAKLDFRTEGDTNGSTFIRMLETTNTPPAPSGDAVHVYMKGDKLIFQAGSSKYFYLDLTTSADQSLIFSSTAP